MSEPHVKHVESQVVAFITMHGPYAQTPEGYGHLYGWVAAHNLVPVGMPAAVYLTMPSETPESDALWELWAPVQGEVAEAEPDASGIGVKRIAPMTVVSLMHKGPYESVGPAYETMWSWMTGRGYSPAGPPMELYYSDPNKVPPEEYLTEIQMPIVAA